MANSPKNSTRAVRGKLEVAERRKTVSAHLLAGWTYREIAAALDVSVGTIASDYKAMLGLWKDHYTARLDEYLYMQLRRYDVMLNAIWGDAKQGNLPLIDRALAIMDRQNALLQLKVMGPQVDETAVFQISVIPARGVPPQLADRGGEGG